MLHLYCKYRNSCMKKMQKADGHPADCKFFQKWFECNAQDNEVVRLLVFSLKCHKWMSFHNISGCCCCDFFVYLFLVLPTFGELKIEENKVILMHGDLRTCFLNPSQYRSAIEMLKYNTIQSQLAQHHLYYCNMISAYQTTNACSHKV